MSNIVFSLRLKVGRDILDLEIDQNDTVTSLVLKMCQNRSDIPPLLMQQKIVGSLSKIAHDQKTDNSLKCKIQAFLKKGQSVVSNKPNKTNAKTQQKLEDKENKEVRHHQLGRHKLSQIDQECSPVRKAGFRQMYDQEEEEQEDQELILAYKVVLSKCKNQELRSLVSQTLKQLRLKEANRQNRQPRRVLSPAQRGRTPSVTRIANKYLLNPSNKTSYQMTCNASVPFLSTSAPRAQQPSHSSHFYEGPVPIQYSIQESRAQRQHSGSQPRKYKYLQEE